MRTKILALILALGWLGIGASFGDSDDVWVGLYLAENTPPHEEATVASEKLTHRLHKVFGFTYYKLIKAEAIEMGKEWSHWVIPRNDFFIRVEPLPHHSGEPKMLDYEIYKDGFIVANGKYEPRLDTPLFICGPEFKQGRLIFVLEAR